MSKLAKPAAARDRERKRLVDAVERGGHLAAIAARVRAELEVPLHREPREQVPPLRHARHPERDAPV